MRANRFWSVDWGTTNLRVRLVDRISQRVLSETVSDEGVGPISQVNPPETRPRAYERALQRAVEDHGEQARGHPAVISGMASSTLGWREVPYGLTPCPLSADGLRIVEVPLEETARVSRAWLVGGWRTNENVMRGEETQLLGLLASEERKGLRVHCRVLLPGTHSKHALVENEALVNFSTYLTGELANLLAHHGVLQSSLAFRADLEPAELADGVARAREGDLLRDLFQVRARQLLQGKTPRENWSFLLGLLVGSELNQLAKDSRDAPILLAAEPPIMGTYAKVAELFAFPNLLVTSPGELSQAVVRAHAMILERVE